MIESEEVTAGSIQQTRTAVPHLALPLYIKAIKANIEETSARTEAIGYAVCDRNSEFLTDSLPESVCKDVISICNAHYYNLINGKESKGVDKILFNVVIPIEPMERAIERVITKNRKGNLFTSIPNTYSKYLNDFYKYTMENQLFLSVKLPIQEKCQVTGYFYISEKANKSIAGYVEALLDCLIHSGIIVSKGRHTVVSIDGSRVFTDSNNPRIEVVVRKRGIE